MAAFVRFARGRVTGNDASHVRAVTVLICRIGQRTIVEKLVHPPRQIGMHRRRVTVVQPGVRHGHGDAGAIEPELLG